MLTQSDPSGPTSLQKIQNLEAEFPTFDLQVTQVKQILRDAAQQRQQVKSNYYGREQWTLRWILKKFDSTKVDGCIASKPAWDLLRDVLSALPSEMASSTLNGSDILSAVEIALTNCAPDHVKSADSSKHLQPRKLHEQNQSGQSDQSNESSYVETRKRKASSDANSRAKKRKTVSKSVPAEANLKSNWELFVSIFGCLYIITESRTQDDSSHKSSQKTNVEQAAKILGASLRACCHFYDFFAEICLAESPGTTIADCLRPGMKLWDRGSCHNGSNVVASSRTFSKFCMAEAIALLRLKLKVCSNLDLVSYRVPQNDPTFVRIERLVAKHIIMPARVSFQDAQHGSSAVELDTNTFLAEVKSLLAPLNKPMGPIQHLRCLRRDQAFAILFGISIRCCRLSSPQEKLTEAPWLEHLLTLFASELEFSFPKTRSAQPFGPSSDALQGMLLAMAKNKLSVSREFLESLTSEYCGLYEGPDDAVRWGLISSVICIDPGMFFKALVSSETSRSSLLDQLAKRISSVGWAGSWLAEGAIAAESRPADYSMIKDEILIPLLKSSSSFGATEKFLWMWHEQLQSPIVTRRVRAREEQSRTESEISLWEDITLVETLEPLLENAFTPNQIGDLLDRLYTHAFSNEVLRKTNEIKGNGGTIFVANAVLCCLRDTETVKQILEKIEKILCACINVLQQTAYSHSADRSKLWRLYSTSFRLWSRVIVTDKIYVKLCGVLDGVQDGLPMDHTLPLFLGHETMYQIATLPPTWSKVQEATEVLAWLGTFLKELSRRNTGRCWQNVPSDLLNLLVTTISMKGHHMDDWARYCICAVVFSYPFALHLPSPIDDASQSCNREKLLEQRRDFFRASLYEARKCHERTENGPRLSALASCWKELINRFLRNDDSIVHFRCNCNLEPQTMYADFLGVLLESEDPTDDNIAKRRRDSSFNQAIYLQMSPKMFSRKQREQILDNVLKDIELCEADEDNISWHLRLSLIAYLFEEPCNSSRIVDLKTGLWPLVQRLDAVLLHRSSDLKLWNVVHDSYERLLELVLSRSRSEDIEGLLGDIVGAEGELVHHAFGPASCKFVRFLAKNLTGRLLSMSISDEKYERQILWHDRIDVLHHRLRENHPVGRETPASEVEVLEAYASLGIGLGKHLDIEPFPSSQNVSREISFFRMKSQAMFFGITAKDSTQEDHDEICLKLAANILNHKDSDLTEKQLGLMRTTISDLFARLDDERGLSNLTSLLTESSDEGEVSTEYGRLRLLYLILSARNDWAQISDMSKLLVPLCERLLQTKNIKEWIVTSSCVQHILQLKNSKLTQSATETLLSTLHTLLHLQINNNNTAPTLPPSHARRIYTHLTHTATLLLTRSSHRKRLQRRSHLFLPILRALLRCLFTPTTGTSRTPRSSSQIQHPSWLDHTKRTLTPREANNLTRILTALCDPTVSSIAGAKSKRDSLTDLTRVARAQAGMLYSAPLLAELCACLLKGVYCDAGRAGGAGGSDGGAETGRAASVREALLPGIWAVLDVLPRGEDGKGGMLDVLGRGVMGGPARAVLRGLVAEWRRVGGRGGKR